MDVKTRRILIVFWAIIGLFITNDIYARSGIIGLVIGLVMTASIGVIFWQISGLYRPKFQKLLGWPLILLFFMPVAYYSSPDVYKETLLMLFGTVLIIVAIVIYLYASSHGTAKEQALSKSA